MSKQDDITNKIKRLNEYVSWFEGEEFSLEESIDKYAEAKKLAEEIQSDLDEYKNKVNLVKKQFDKE